ncbi:MAG: VCBS repeat-containing protein [Saprospiraceae bacterium]|nr:VCBS repeat-containing protein [Saprospiraceae bacterium]
MSDVHGMVSCPASGHDTIPFLNNALSEICDNQSDDDNDGLIDVFDPDCPCEDKKFNTVCIPECEVLPDSFPKIEAKVKWVSEHGINNNPYPLYYNDLLVSKGFIYTTSNDFYKDSFINYIILTDPINGKLIERWVIDTTKIRILNKFGIFRSIQSNSDKLVISNSEGNFFCRDKENTFWNNYDIHNSDYSTLPIFSDINNDGNIELISGNYIINSENGKILLHLSGTSAGCNSWTNFSSCASGARSMVGELTNHIGLEIACGNKVYQPTLNNSIDSFGNTYSEIIAPSPVLDGFTSLVDIDADGKLDIVVVRSNGLNNGGIWIWNPRDTTIIASITNGLEIGQGGGMPAIIDMNNDCFPEIIVAFKNSLKVYSYNGNQNLNLLYSIPTSDNSGVNSPTIFDLNGDGIFEIIYKDQTKFRIFNSLNGQTLFESPLIHGTANEIPIITDVDDDGHAEIIIDGTMPGDTMNRIYCFESANEPWMPARKIWNQSSYHVTNVNDDMTIPQVPQNTAAFFDTNSCIMTTCPQVYNTFNVQATYRTQNGCVPYPAKDFAAHHPDYECNPDSVIIYLPVSAQSKSPGDSVSVVIWQAAPLQGTVPLFYKNIFFESSGLRNIKNDTLRLVFPLTDPTISRVMIRVNAPQSAGIQGSLEGLTTLKECNYDNNSIALDLDLNIRKPTIGRDTSFCGEISLSPDVGTGFTSYLWSDMSAGPSISISEAGIYSITTTDQCGRSYSDTMLVSQIEYEESLDDVVNVCPGDTMTLQITDDYLSIQWSPSDLVLCADCPVTQVVPQNSTTVYLSVQKDHCVFMDSIFLQVKHEVITDINSTLCFGDTLFFGNASFSQSGIYTLPVNDCDSLVRLEIDVRPDQRIELQKNICEGDSVQVFGVWYYDEYEEIQLFTDQFGCDSIFKIKILKIAETSDSVLTVLCQGQDIVIEGLLVDKDTIIEYHLPSSSGCDTLRVHSIRFDPLPQKYDTLALCSGSQLLYRGEVITSPGDYIITQNNPEQCDSLFYLHVALSSVIRNESIRTLCDGDSLFIFNQWVYDDTTLEETFVSSSGCDSVSVVVVNVVLLPERTLNISLCEGDSVKVYNSWLSDEGMYDFRIANTADCDSLITVTIDLIESSAHYDTLSFCEGDTLMFDGSLITTTADVTVNRLSSTGCDSIFYIRAEMLPLHQKEISLTLCPGDSVLIGGDWFDSSGVFTYKTNAVIGCDTLHTVRVDILQPPQAPDILADCETGEVVVSILASENWLVEWDNGDTTFVTRYQSGEEAEVSFFAEPDCRGKYTVQLPEIPDPDLIELPEDTVTDGTRSIRFES